MPENKNAEKIQMNGNSGPDGKKGFTGKMPVGWK
jgi:hypothetical protein